MGELLGVPVDGGGRLLVRLGPSSGSAVSTGSEASGGSAVPGNEGVSTGPVPARRGGDPAPLGERIVMARESLVEALAPIAAASRDLLVSLRPSGPSEIEVEFGVEFSAESSAILASAGGGVHLNVTLVWKPGEDGDRSAAAAVAGAEPGFVGV